MSENFSNYKSYLNRAEFIAQGNDSFVYRDRATQLVFKRYDTDRVQPDMVDNYVALTNLAASKGRIIKDKTKLVNNKYNLSVYIEPVLAVGDDNNERVAVVSYVPGPRGESLIPSPTYEEEFSTLVGELPEEEQERLMVLKQTIKEIGLNNFYKLDLIHKIRKTYGLSISKKIGRKRNENPVFEIGLENTRIGMPSDNDITVNITDLSLMIG